ncbi:SPFH domain-containing protein [Microbacterium gorillae]|uniref:SPFH domain-containing protein n=1 Tax=Microbacterium gorillae TaxID=1231063 RepID=UPI000694B85B|nr:SPFH domain-containing protein [Microbacterium gorillae]
MNEPALATVVALALVILAAIAVARSVRIIPRDRVGLVERLGRYQRTLDPGVHLLLPIVDRVRVTVDMLPQELVIPTQPVITRDDYLVSIDTSLRFQVVDARAATYEVVDHVAAMERLTITTLRELVGTLDRAAVADSRTAITSRLSTALARGAAAWGLRLVDVAVTAIDVPDLADSPTATHPSAVTNSSVRGAAADPIPSDREELTS